MKTYRLIIADDYTPFRKLERVILSNMPDIEVIGEAGDGLELINLLDRLCPNMAIVDIVMPKLNGIEATRWIRESHPDIKVLVLTSHKERIFLYEAFRAGAQGYLLKEDNIIEELPSAIEVVRKGGVYASALVEERPSARRIQVM